MGADGGRLCGLGVFLGLRRRTIGEREDAFEIGVVGHSGIQKANRTETVVTEIFAIGFGPDGRKKAIAPALNGGFAGIRPADAGEKTAAGGVRHRFQIGDPSCRFGVFVGIERKMIEVDQEAGEITGRIFDGFKRGYHLTAGRFVNDLGNPGGGVGKLAERSELIPTVSGQFKVAVQDKIHTQRVKIKRGQNQRTEVRGQRSDGIGRKNAQKAQKEVHHGKHRTHGKGNVPAAFPTIDFHSKALEILNYITCPPY